MKVQLQLILGSIVTWLALLPSLSAAQTATTSVYVLATAEDQVGTRLVYAIKEGIRRSAGLRLVERNQDAGMIVNIVTMDPDTDRRGNWTAYSVAWTAKTLHDTPVNMFITNTVGTCGTNRVTQCADGLVADTDREASALRAIIRDVLDRQKR